MQKTFQDALRNQLTMIVELFWLSELFHLMITLVGQLVVNFVQLWNRVEYINWLCFVEFAAV